MNDDDLIHPFLQIAIAFVGTGGGAAALIALLKEAWKTRQAKRMDTGYLDINAVWEETQTLGIEVDADRVLVLKSENGGGLPAPGVLIKNTVSFEYRSGELPPVRGLWQQIPIDSHYAEMLSVISTGLWYWKNTTEIPEGAVFRDLSGDGILVGAARICKTHQALWYLCVQFKNADMASGAKRQKIRASLHKLRTIFARHHNLLIGEAS